MSEIFVSMYESLTYCHIAWSIIVILLVKIVLLSDEPAKLLELKIDFPLLAQHFSSLRTVMLAKHIHYILSLSNQFNRLDR